MSRRRSCQSWVDVGVDGVGSRKGVLLGGRSLIGRAVMSGMPWRAAGLAGVGIGASGEGAAFIRVEKVADPAWPGATADLKGLTGSRCGDLDVVFDFKEEVHSENIPRDGAEGTLHPEMAIVLESHTDG